MLIGTTNPAGAGHEINRARNQRIVAFVISRLSIVDACQRRARQLSRYLRPPLESGVCSLSVCSHRTGGKLRRIETFSHVLEFDEILEFVRDGTKRGVQLHLAVELLFPFEPGLQLLSFPLLRLNRPEAGDVLRETLARCAAAAGCGGERSARRARRDRARRATVDARHPAVAAPSESWPR